MKTRNNLYLTALFASIIAASATGMTVYAEAETETIEETVSSLSDDPQTQLIQNASDYVELCDLTELSLTSYYSTVTDDDVELEIENILYEYVDYENVEGGAELGDLLTMNMTTTVDGETTTDEDVVYELGYAEFGDDFDDALDGVQVGDVIELDVTFEEDDYVYDEWLGNTVSFSLEITEVSRTVIPDLTEEFVQETLGYESIDAFREEIREELQANVDLQNEQTTLTLAVDSAVEASTILSYPDGMVDEAVESIREQYAALAEMFGMEVDDLFEAYGIDEATLTEQAEADVAHRMLVSAVIQQEGLSFTQAELDETAEALYEYYEYDSAEELAEDFGDELVYLAGDMVVGQYLLDTGLVTEEEDISYTEDEYLDDEDTYYIDGDADAWFEEDTEDEDSYLEEGEEEEYWDEEELSEEEEDSNWEIEEDTEEE